MRKGMPGVSSPATLTSLLSMPLTAAPPAVYPRGWGRTFLEAWGVPHPSKICRTRARRDVLVGGRDVDLAGSQGVVVGEEGFGAWSGWLLRGWRSFREAWGGGWHSSTLAGCYAKKVGLESLESSAITNLKVMYTIRPGVISKAD